MCEKGNSFVEVCAVETASGRFLLSAEDVSAGAGETVTFHAAIAWRTGRREAVVTRLASIAAVTTVAEGVLLEERCAADGWSTALGAALGFCANPRTENLVEMGDAMRCVRVAGLFEVHVTVQEAAVERFRSLCEELGRLKVIQIELGGPARQRQLMTASYHSARSIAEAQKIAFGLARVIGREFAIERVKIEALCHNEGVPENGDYPSSCYFEFHAKLLLDPAQIPQLLPLCAAHAAHLSRNALKAVGTREHRFVTQRIYGVGRGEAVGRFEACTAALVAAGFEIVSRQREFSVYDTNVNLDAEWLDKSLIKSL
jgi:hypothetical protein